MRGLRHQDQLIQGHQLQVQPIPELVMEVLQGAQMRGHQPQVQPIPEPAMEVLQEAQTEDLPQQEEVQHQVLLLVEVRQLVDPQVEEPQVARPLLNLKPIQVVEVVALLPHSLTVNKSFIMSEGWILKYKIKWL